MSDKGFLASICSFFKGLFSSDSDDCCGNEKSKKTNDGLTGVERYIRSRSQNGEQLTSVENYVRNKLGNAGKPLTGVENYVRNSVDAKPLTGVERYVRSKS